MIQSPILAGRAVVVERTNAVGFVVKQVLTSVGRRVHVRFCAAGRPAIYSPGGLRWARRSEVVAAGIIGVGHRTQYAPEPEQIDEAFVRRAVLAERRRCADLCLEQARNEFAHEGHALERMADRILVDPEEVEDVPVNQRRRRKS